MRAPSDSRISRSAMLRRATALYSFTGTLRSPKLIEPLQIALAIGSSPTRLFQPIARAAKLGGSAAGGILRPARWDHPPVLFELREVSLTRGDRRVLDSVSAAIPAGVTAIVGPSGAGKSTLLRLLNRLADPDAATICLRGRPLAEYDPLALRREVSLVPQLPALLEGTVESNLAYAAGLAGKGAGRRALPAPRRARPGLRRPRRRQALGRRAAAGHAGARAGAGARRSCCSTSRPRPSTTRPATRSRRPSPSCAGSSRSRSSWSATTPSRRGGWATGWCGSSRAGRSRSARSRR